MAGNKLWYTQKWYSIVSSFQINGSKLEIFHILPGSDTHIRLINNDISCCHKEKKSFSK